MACRLKHQTRAHNASIKREHTTQALNASTKREQQTQALNASNKRKQQTQALMGATRPASGYFSAPSSFTSPLEVAFCEQGVSPYVSYRQGEQPCLSLCEKPRRQPYVTYVAYVLMSTAVSGTRAKPETAPCPTRDASPPLELAFGGSVGCLSLQAGRQPYVSYRQGDQPCLNLCEKPQRQPYVTYVAYVLMSTAVSGARADSP